MVKLKIKGESKEEKFKRIAEARTNKILEQIAILRNCANTQIYSYNELQINKIFKALDEELRLTKMTFSQRINKKRDIKL